MGPARAGILTTFDAGEPVIRNLAP